MTSLYLVSFTLVTTQYMVDGEKREQKVRLVEATSEEEASDKVETFYEKASSPYCIYYSVDVDEVSGVIR